MAFENISSDYILTKEQLNKHFKVYAGPGAGKTHFLVENIKEIVSLGRKRWKIENEGFYTQKHRTFNISHLNSRNDTAIKNHYLFIQFAHTIRQLLDLGSNTVISFQGKIKEISFSILNELISTPINLIENKNFQLRFDKLII